MEIDQFTAVVILSGFVLVWYLTGLAYNKRLLGAYWKKLNVELLELKANPKLRSIQSSSITISTGSLGKNLTSAQLSVVLIGRQNPFSFAFARAQKHFDLISLKGDMKEKPSFEFELLNGEYHLTKSLLTYAFKDWGQENVSGTQFVYCWEYGKLPLSSEFKNVSGLWRISIRKASPNLLVTLRAGDPKSGRLLQWVKDLDTLLTKALDLSGVPSKR